MSITAMPYEEKNTWIYALVTVLASGTYWAIVLTRAQEVPIAKVHYVGPMLWTIGGAVIASVVGHVVVAAAWPKEAGKKDQRDREIYRLGERVGQSFLVIGALLALVLSMLNVDHFWIANAIYVGFVLSALLGSVTRLVAYHRDFTSW